MYLLIVTDPIFQLLFHPTLLISLCLILFSLVTPHLKHRIMKGMEILDRDDLLKWGRRETRGQEKKLKKDSYRRDLKKNSFPYRVIDVWNKLNGETLLPLIHYYNHSHQPAEILLLQATSLFSSLSRMIQKQNILRAQLMNRPAPDIGPI
ncbi:uncharacterized protein LOC143030705 isoform X1 [Oratosquilla oratoria]|uniref:uncharacterized protein LOC143030705 isoform X1 n=1 Tax=Oratosquilla oratoria TaxID=337810 RepID=UPI003F7731F3